MALQHAAEQRRGAVLGLSVAAAQADQPARAVLAGGQCAQVGAHVAQLAAARERRPLFLAGVAQTVGAVDSRRRSRAPSCGTPRSASRGRAWRRPSRCRASRARAAPGSHGPACCCSGARRRTSAGSRAGAAPAASRRRAGSPACSERRASRVRMLAHRERARVPAPCNR